MDARAWARFAAGRPLHVAAAMTALAVLTGAALAFGYDARPAAAHGAVAALPAWLRGVHAWAASLALLAALLALARCWMRGAEPRAWYRGCAVVFLLLLAQWGGGVLAWDQQGWESLQHAYGAAGLPAPAPSAAPLAALVVAHAALAALLLLALAGAGPRGELPARAREAWRAGAPLVPVAAVLALAAPPVLGPAPIEGLRVSRPDWPFLWLAPLQDALGPAALVVGPALAVSAALLAPRLGAHCGFDQRRLVLAAAAGVLLLLSAASLR